MTISTIPLENRHKDDYRLILLPQNNADTSRKFTTLQHEHPATGKLTDFAVCKHSNNKTELFVLDRLNWKNSNVKNQAYTPDGKPYRCLFITKNTTSKECVDSVPATVLGTDPTIYMLTPFSPIYLLLNYFKPIIQKKIQNGTNDENDKRLLSYEDLTDSIFQTDLFISQLVKDYSIDIKPFLEIICESSSIPSMESDDEDTETFYKPSIEKVKKFVIQKIETLVQLLLEKDSFPSLKIRMETMYPTDIPDNIKLLLWQKQAISLLQNYLDKWYIDISISYDFSKLESFISELKEQERAQDMIDESLQQLHEGTNAVIAAQRNKKTKPVKKATKPPKVTPVAVGKGKLDMFFKKKA